MALISSGVEVGVQVNQLNSLTPMIRVSSGGTMKREAIDAPIFQSQQNLEMKAMLDLQESFIDNDESLTEAERADAKFSIMRQREVIESAEGNAKRNAERIDKAIAHENSGNVYVNNGLPQWVGGIPLTNANKTVLLSQTEPWFVPGTDKYNDFASPIGKYNLDTDWKLIDVWDWAKKAGISEYTVADDSGGFNLEKGVSYTTTSLRGDKTNKAERMGLMMMFPYSDQESALGYVARKDVYDNTFLNRNNGAAKMSISKDAIYQYAHSDDGLYTLVEIQTVVPGQGETKVYNLYENIKGEDGQIGPVQQTQTKTIRGRKEETDIYSEQDIAALGVNFTLVNESVGTEHFAVIDILRGVMSRFDMLEVVLNEDSKDMSSLETIYGVRRHYGAGVKDEDKDKEYTKIKNLYRELFQFGDTEIDKMNMDKLRKVYNKLKNEEDITEEEANLFQKYMGDDGIVMSGINDRAREDYAAIVNFRGRMEMIHPASLSVIKSITSKGGTVAKPIKTSGDEGEGGTDGFLTSRAWIMLQHAEMIQEPLVFTQNMGDIKNPKWMPLEGIGYISSANTDLNVYMNNLSDGSADKFNAAREWKLKPENNKSGLFGTPLVRTITLGEGKEATEYHYMVNNNEMAVTLKDFVPGGSTVSACIPIGGQQAIVRLGGIQNQVLMNNTEILALGTEVRTLVWNGEDYGWYDSEGKRQKADATRKAEGDAAGGEHPIYYTKVPESLMLDTEIAIRASSLMNLNGSIMEHKPKVANNTTISHLTLRDMKDQIDLYEKSGRLGPIAFKPYWRHALEQQDIKDVGDDKNQYELIKRMYKEGLKELASDAKEDGDDYLIVGKIGTLIGEKAFRKVAGTNGRDKGKKTALGYEFTYHKGYYFVPLFNDRPHEQTFVTPSSYSVTHKYTYGQAKNHDQYLKKNNSLEAVVK